MRNATQGLILCGALAIAAAQTACGAKGGGGAGAAPAPAGSSFDAAKVEGAWTTECARDPSGNPFWMQKKLELSQGRFKQMIGVYQDEACQQALGSGAAVEGTYSIGAPSASEPGAVEIDVLAPPPGGGSPQTVYDLCLVQDGVLYLGEYQGLNPESRPQTVDRKVAYRKQQ